MISVPPIIKFNHIFLLHHLRFSTFLTLHSLMTEFIIFFLSNEASSSYSSCRITYFISLSLTYFITNDRSLSFTVVVIYKNTSFKLNFLQQLENCVAVIINYQGQRLSQFLNIVVFQIMNQTIPKLTFLSMYL